MVKQPSAIIIVRHGTRLDQADKSWRATAEHPYDPPLSYGGWIQCQTLGARIDKELLSLEQQVTPADLERQDHGESSRPPRKRRKIILHSSPYKRCVQTSIAIAAGLRYPTPDRVRPLPTPFQRASQKNIRTTSTSEGAADTDATSATDQQAADIPQKEEKNDKIDLKIDAYLGEWLSSSYFEDSKPPPSTDVILERAKETMTRPIEEIRGADLSAFLPVPESPDLDKENFLSANLSSDKGGLRAMAAVGHSMPHRNRTTSFGVNGTTSANHLVAQRIRQRARTTNVYSPPVPQYSLAPQDNIPPGYVAHARDACVNPDIQWDSIEMGWGDGGSYPEEWGAMHVRFRLGLQKLLAYYEDYRIPDDPTDNDDDDAEDEVVLVLVTHQAGANALIRLMTGAPALHDVGVASLTLAVRRPVLRRPPSLTRTNHSPLGFDRENRRNSRRGSLDLGLADDFEMKIIASTDHLRNGSNPLGLNSPNSRMSPAIQGRRLASDALDSFSIGESMSYRPGGTSSLARGASQRGRTGDSNRSNASSTGLWGSPAFPAVAREPIDEKFEELPPMSPKSRPSTPAGSDSVPDSSLSSPTRSRSSTVQSAGLWGSNNATLAVRSSSGGTWTPPGSSDGTLGSGSVSRARSPAKRRWTAVSNSP